MLMAFPRFWKLSNSMFQGCHKQVYITELKKQSSAVSHIYHRHILIWSPDHFLKNIPFRLSLIAKRSTGDEVEMYLGPCQASVTEFFCENGFH